MLIAFQQNNSSNNAVPDPSSLWGCWPMRLESGCYTLAGEIIALFSSGTIPCFRCCTLKLQEPGDEAKWTHIHLVLMLQFHNTWWYNYMYVYMDYSIVLVWSMICGHTIDAKFVHWRARVLHSFAIIVHFRACQVAYSMTWQPTWARVCTVKTAHGIPKCGQ